MPEESFHGARPSSGLPRRSDPPRDNLPYQQPTTLAETEDHLKQAMDQLMELADDNKRLRMAAASARADWEAHLATIIVQLRNEGVKTAKDERTAIALMTDDPETGRSGKQLKKEFDITKAAADSSTTAMSAFRAVIDGLRTTAANVRYVTN